MKRLLVLSILLLAYNAQAQKVSLAAGVGAAFNGSPTDNMVYKSEQSLLNYALQAKLTRTTVTNWQFGIGGHMHELSGKTTKKYGGFYNRHLKIDSVGGDGKKLVYAKQAVSATVFVNKNIPLGGPKASFYIGAAFGYTFSRNNSLYYAENESYKGPDGGRGLCYGGQLGINAYLSEYVSFYFELAPRYYNYTFDKEVEAPQIRPYERLEYSVFAFPITIGLSFDLHKNPSTQTNLYNPKKKKYYR